MMPRLIEVGDRGFSLARKQAPKSRSGSDYLGKYHLLGKMNATSTLKYSRTFSLSHSDLQSSQDSPHWNQYSEVIAAKVRDGLSGEVSPLCFTGSFASFSDWPRAWKLPQFEE